MAAIIGGRMEVVTPHRSLTGPDYGRLAILIVIAAAIHLWLVAHTAVTARDSIGFARYALRLQSPFAASVPWDHNRIGLDVIKEEKHPPGYPVAIWLTAKVVRNSTSLPLSESTLFAAQLVSASAAVLLVFPMYLLGRMLFGRNVAFAAALLFQILPVPARITSDGLTEGLYLLVTVTALVIGVRAVRRPGVGGFLLCGLTAGFSYLVRPEGLMVVGAVAAVAGWLGLTRKWPRDLTLGRLTALAVGVALVAGPYVMLIGKLTNKPTGVQILPSSFNDPRSGLSTDKPAASAPNTSSGSLFAAWWTVPEGSSPIKVSVPALVAAAKETGKGLHYLAAGLALFGLIALRRRIAAEPGLCVLIALASMNAAVLVSLGVTGYYAEGKRTFYVSERHALLLVLIGTFFAIAALEPLSAAIARLCRAGRLCGSRFVPVVVFIALIATALPITLKPLHQHREGHKHAGEWLRQAEKDRKEEYTVFGLTYQYPPPCIIDPFEWADWYSERTHYVIPPDPVSDEWNTYAVIDNTKTRLEDHERLPRQKSAINVMNDVRSKCVYHWPENISPDEALVKIYQLNKRPKIVPSQ